MDTELPLPSNPSTPSTSLGAGSPLGTNSPSPVVETPAVTPSPVETFSPAGPEAPAVMPFEEKPSIIKRFLPIILILIVLVVGLVVASKFLLPNVSKVGKSTLIYWGLWEPEGAMAGVIADFEKANPDIKVNYLYNSPTEYRERLSSAFAQNKGPDVFRFHNTWVPMFKNELSPVPSSVMDNATYESTFYPVAAQDLKIGNNYVGIPLEIDGLGMYINEDLFTAAGKTPPTTWDELRKTASELTTPAQRSRGEIQIAGVALGRTENVDHWSDILAAMMLQNGADLNKPTGQLAEDALTYFTLFSQSDLVWDETLPSSTQLFASGKLAIYFGPSWEAFMIKQANPNLNFKILPIPQLTDTNTTWASYWVEGVSKKSPNQDAAWKFVKYLSGKETMEKLYKTESDLRLFGEPYSRRELGDLLKDSKYVGAFVQQAQAAKSGYLSSDTHDNGINDKIIKYFEDAVNAVNSGKSDSKQALETASQGVSQVLNQYGISASVVR